MRVAHTLPKMLACALLLARAMPGEAQVRVVGRVIDNVLERPLGGAQVTARTADGRFLSRVESAADGTFEFEVNRISSVRIEVRRISYRANVMPLLYFDGREFFQVEVRLDPQAILLAPLEVIAWSTRPYNAVHEGFRRRLQTGLGFYITREQIAQKRPMLVSDLLREVPGLQVVASGSGRRPTVQVARARGKSCSTQIFVDGFLINRRRTADGPPDEAVIDDLVFPEAVEGVEVYRGLSTVPPEFLTPDADCGVVAIWTRRGG